MESHNDMLLERKPINNYILKTTWSILWIGTRNRKTEGGGTKEQGATLRISATPADQGKENKRGAQILEDDTEC